MKKMSSFGLFSHLASLRNIAAGIGMLVWLANCSPVSEQEQPGKTLFTLLKASETGIDFSNDLSYDRKFNIYTYRNFYNGGGVAVGDINGDGLMDIYLTANMLPNRLYLNKGNFVFEDITEKAGVAGTRAWATGVSMADVNGDGLLDIYVCNSGDVAGDNKQNELFINQGDGTFLEEAERYGLADPGFSTHAAFFDYDRDGDLDLYLLNNSYQAIGSFNLRKNERPNRDPVGGDKLFRNEGGTFVDVSEQAGIYGSVIGFGLGVTVGDVNLDGWLDIYVSNDFFERDYLYINNQDGTFSERLTEQIRSISGASMGADMADINNDGLPDIFVTEMLPEPNDRVKTVTTFENWDRYQYNLNNDYYHQFTRNMLHLNNGLKPGNGDMAKGKPVFYSEIGRLAKVEATDWSWGALMVDLDQDGQKDIFVANGIYQDLTDQDFINYISNEETVKSILSENNVNYQQLIDAIPVNPIPNYAFANLGNLQFVNKAQEWGLATPSHSNGAAYADLDNDGDLDLVVNNVNMPLFVYRNELDNQANDRNYLQLVLQGTAPNTYALGARIKAVAGQQAFYLEQMPMRGFQSTVDPRPHIGLGSISLLDSLIVDWPDGKQTILKNVQANQMLILKQAEANPVNTEGNGLPQEENLFSTHHQDVLPYVHKENNFVDFDRDRLLFHMSSTQGPKMAVADVNGDGLEDVFIGGAKDSPGALFLQTSQGSFRESKQPAFEADKVSEDIDATFFDANGDGHPDLYVASGGSEFSSSSSALADRLYLNNGKGVFSKSPQILPASKYENTSCVRPFDFDQDGDLDLFVGISMEAFRYGLPMTSYLLQNDGKGNFSNVTDTWAQGLMEVGMVTDAHWADLNADGLPDLVVIGEWMPIKIFMNRGSSLEEVTQKAGLANSHGWWNRLLPADVDGDGHLDFVVGNHGLNSRFRATPDKPVSMYVADFDRNGSVEQIICTYNGEKQYPLVLRHDLIKQLPYLKKKYLKYENYRDQTIEDIFSAEELAKALKLDAYYLESCLLRNQGDGSFVLEALPVAAQLSPVYALLARDFTGDGKTDLMLAGNLFEAKPEVGRYDASYGTLLAGDGQGNFQAVANAKTGLFLQGQIRDLKTLTTASGKWLLAAQNNGPIQMLKIKPSIALNLP